MSEMEGSVPRARVTPYELVFGFEDFETERFPAMRDEARARGAGADPDSFLQLTSTGLLARELLPDGADGAERADGEALLQLGRLLYQAYNFWLFGRRLVVVEERLARRLLAGAPAVGEWELTPPHAAGYLQLPRNLLWARIDSGSTPEPVDGIFWTMVGAQDAATPPYPRLDALLALGVRPDRPGFSVMDVSAAPGEAPGHWADVQARAAGAGADFSSVLPGGELAGLFTLETEAEVLKLLSLLFHHAASNPGVLSDVAPAAAGATSAAESELPYQVLRDSPARG